MSEQRQSRKVAETILKAKEKLVNATSEVKAVTSRSASVCQGADMGMNTVTDQSRNQSGSAMLLFYNQAKSDQMTKINDLVKASGLTSSEVFIISRWVVFVDGKQVLLSFILNYLWPFPRVPCQ